MGMTETVLILQQHMKSSFRPHDMSVMLFHPFRYLY